ncbi:MAG: rhodanese-like domain-containing protein [Candidatus Limnocylindrales bacterium]
MLPLLRPSDPTGDDVDPVDVARDLASGRGILVDVREAGEWQAGHAPGSRHIPLARLVAAATDLPPDAPVFVICRSGNRSRLGAELLRRKGVSGAVNVRGGLLSWARAGLPLER